MEINVLQIISQIVNFGVVFGALTFLLYKPMLKAIDERRKKTEDAERFAADAMKEKEELEGMKKRTKTQAEKDAAKIVDSTREEVKTLKTKLTKEAKEEVAAYRAKEMQKVENEVKSSLTKMEERVTKLSLAVASKVIGNEIKDAKSHKAVISQSIKDLDKALGQL